MRALALCVLTLAACTPIDVESGNRYVCRPDGGAADQCPGPFHCGLEGRCLPNEPGPWACGSSDDCYGWHCGPSARCYDLATARDVACGGDDDCNAERGWRCGPDARCVDATLERLRTADPIGTPPTLQRKVLWRGAPSHVESGLVETLRFDGGVDQKQIISLVSGGELIRLEMPASFFYQPTPYFSRSSAALPAPALALAVHREFDVVVNSAGRLGSAIHDGGVGVYADSSYPERFTALRSSANEVVAFGPHTLWYYGDDTAWLTDFDAGAPLRDVFVRHANPLSSGGSGMLLVADGVLLEARLGGASRLSDVTPRGIASGVSGECNSFPLASRYVESATTLFIHSEHIAGPVVNTFQPAAGDDGGCALSVPRQNSHWELGGFHRSFPAGCRPAAASVVGDRAAFTCLLADGGVLLSRGFEDGRLVPGPTAASSSDLMTGYFAGEFPGLWLLAADELVPALFDRIPRQAVAMAGDRVLVMADFDAGSVPTVGGVAIDGVVPSFPMSGASTFEIRGAASWLGYGNVVYALDPLPVSLAIRTSLPLEVAVGSAALSTRRDGGTLLLLGSDDRLVHVTPSVDGGVSDARTVLVPEPGLTIRTIDMPDDLLGARFAGGYLIASGRLFRFFADNAVVWRATELVLGDEEAIDVWHEGLRGRAGFRNGVVVSLPSRVPVAPATSAPVRDFEQACEYLFAATEDGLEQLAVEPGGVVGGWHRLESKPGGAKLFFHKGKLTVFWSDGSYSELRVPGCAG